MKKNSLLSLLLLLTAFPVVAQHASSAGQKLGIAEYIISQFYVDKVDEDKVVEDAIRGMLTELDPHSTYISPEEVQEMNEPLQGNFDGIGIQFNMNKDTLYVVQTIVGGPSEKVGLRAGDRIIAVNDSTIAGVEMSNSDIMKRLRGKKGTKVNVTVLRKGVAEPLVFRITRDKIPIYSIDASFMVDKKTGYILLSRFGATSHEEFKEAMAKLQKEGMKQLILDLQGNGGGYLGTAIALADEFLSQDQLIVYTQGERSPRQEEYATAAGIYQENRVVVLVDETSASASEILSGALQDWDRAVVVGRRTYGKGLVQRQFPLPDNSMMRLTVARYYTPTGRSIQRPYEEGTDAYNHDLIDRYNSGELLSADSIHFPDSLRYNTLTTGRTVYGGGGIMPDLFVPIDTTRLTNYHRDLIAQGVVNDFCIDYIDTHRKGLTGSYPTEETFIERFEVTPEMLDDLVALAEKADIPCDTAQWNQSKTYVARQLKALIGRDLFTSATYIRIMNRYNEPLQQALEVINDPKRYHELLQGGSTQHDKTRKK